MEKVRLLVIGFFFLCLEIQAQEAIAPYVLTEVKDEYNDLTSATYVWTDSMGAATVSEVYARLLGSTNDFQLLPENNNLLPASYPHWGCIVLQNQTGRDIDLHFGAYADYTTIYLFRGGPIEEYPTGRFRSANKMKDPNHRKGIPLLLHREERVTVLFRSESINSYDVYMKPALRREQYMYERVLRHQSFQGFFQGILWIMLLYNLLTYFSSKDRSYLYYVGYLLCGSVYFFYLYGWLTDYITANVPKIDSYIWMLSVYGSTLFYAHFTRAYFHTEEKVPHADRAIKWWIRLEWLVLSLVLGIIAWSYNIELVRHINMAVTFIGTIFSLWVVWQLRVIKTRIYYLFLVGALTYLLSVVLFFYGLVLANWGWIPPISGVFMSYLVEAGLVTEILCFSIGLSYRMQQSEMEKREAQEALILQLESYQIYQDATNRQLEIKVKQRTKEIGQQHEEITSQKEHLQAQKEQLEVQFLELRELNEEKNHLMGVLAHDLRNPLTSLLTVANLLKSEKEELSQDHQEYVDLFLRSLHRMQELIAKTLDARQKEAVSQSLKLKPVSMCEVVEEVVNEFETKAQQKHIRLLCRQSLDKAVYAHLDRQYFYQVVENLLSNALKYSPSGTEVTVGVKEEEGRSLFYVSDQGPGLREEDKPKLFQKFQRLSAQPTAGETSTGLGLSIVKKYTDAMRGKVWCENNPDKGCTFWVAFTLCPSSK